MNPSTTWLVVMPTYNEKDNLAALLESLHRVSFIKSPDVLIVDDNSPDGTGALAESLRERYPKVNVLHRAEKKGLGRAYRDGFRWGLNRSYDWLVEMDADFSHDPQYLSQVEQLIRENRQDVLIGSRYTAGGGIQNWPWHRCLISRLGSLYSRAILGCPVRDLTGGFNAWRSEVLRAIDLNAILSDGYAFQIELKYKAWRRGFRLHEFPITFVDRTAGRSKMSRRIVWEALINTLRLRA